MVAVYKRRFRHRLFDRDRALLLLLLWEVLAREVRGPAAVTGTTPSPRIVAMPTGTLTARVWVDERRRVNLVG